jgi:hypothetical protein
MHKARSFFFVCAGIFLLALAYHLGVRSATAQAGGQQLSVAQIDWSAPDGDWVVTNNGTVIRVAHGGPDCAYPSLSASVVGKIPSTSRIIHFNAGCNPNLGAYAEDGSIYVSSDWGATWSYRGNVLTGPTPATLETWGGVKARYRPGAATQDK